MVSEPKRLAAKTDPLSLLASATFSSISPASFDFAVLSTQKTLRNSSNLSSMNSIAKNSVSNSSSNQVLTATADLLIYSNLTNIKVAVHASVERVLLSASSTIGVVYRDDAGQYHHVILRDKGEVIFCACAIGTPQLLLLSGNGAILNRSTPPPQPSTAASTGRPPPPGTSATPQPPPIVTSEAHQSPNSFAAASGRPRVSPAFLTKATSTGRPPPSAPVRLHPYWFWIRLSRGVNPELKICRTLLGLWVSPLIGFCDVLEVKNRSREMGSEVIEGKSVTENS